MKKWVSARKGWVKYKAEVQKIFINNYEEEAIHTHLSIIICLNSLHNKWASVTLKQKIVISNLDILV